MDGLPISPLGAAGIIGFLLAVNVGLVLTVAKLILSGDLVPRVTHERELEAAEHNANEWRTEGRIKDQMLSIDLAQIKKTDEEIGHSLHKFMSDLQRVIGIKPPSEEP